MTVHIHLTVQEMPSGKWVGTIRRDGGQDMPFALTRPFEHRSDAVRWLVEHAKQELSTSPGGVAA